MVYVNINAAYASCYDPYAGMHFKTVYELPSLYGSEAAEVFGICHEIAAQMDEDGAGVYFKENGDIYEIEDIENLTALLKACPEGTNADKVLAALPNLPEGVSYFEVNISR